MAMHRRAAQFSGVLLVLFLWISAELPWAAGMTDPAQALAERLWTVQRRDAVIQVRVDLDAEKSKEIEIGHNEKVGTAFMVSDTHALTAAHVVCDEVTKKPLGGILLFVGGPGAGDGVKPEVAVCYPDNADLAIIKVPSINRGRRYIELGAYEDLRSDGFVTIFGYGGAQPGRPLKGNAVFPLDNDNRVRVDMNASSGDSGAPVLDRTGRAVGVLTAGATGKAAMIPLRMFGPQLERLSVFMPKPDEGATDSAPRVPDDGLQQNLVARGVVRINLGKGPDGKWIWPPSRRATRDEVQLHFTMYSPLKTVETITSGDDGVWVLPLPSQVPRPGIEYSAFATHIEDLERPPDSYLYRRDPKLGVITQATLPKPIFFDLYARPAYVRYHFARANEEADLLFSSRQWKACGGGKATECSRKKPRTLSYIQTQITAAEEEFSRAFGATSSEEGDIENGVSVATTWSAFRLNTGRACEAVVSMQSLFEKFSYKNVSPSVISQTLNMVVRCLQMPGNLASAVMPWLMKNETRQTASVRLMMEILDAYGGDPTTLSPVRRAVIRELTTAFELYTTKVVRISEAARAIKGNKELFGRLSQFVGKFVVPWCGQQKISQPRNDAKAIQRTLVDMRSLITTCP